MSVRPTEHEHVVRYAVDRYRVVECDSCRGQPYALQEKDGRSWVTLRFDADLLRLQGLMMARDEERERLRARMRAAQRVTGHNDALS